MKPYDLYQHFHSFCEMLENDKISIEARMQLGREWLQALPAPMLCVPYELSRDVVFQAMRGRLQEQEIKHGRGVPKAAVKEKDPQRQEPEQEPPRAGSEPIRQDAGDGRGKVAVEDLDGPKVSKTKRQGAGKTSRID